MAGELESAGARGLTDSLSPAQTARVLAVANQKGGVGKSTTAVNMGAWLALQGNRVLLMDLDPQANATTGVGVDPRRVSGNMYQILVEDLPLEDAIEPTAIRNLFCIPSTIDLAGAEIELVAAFSRELKLKRALETAKSEFDYILIDCPPSLGLLTVNALAAAEEVIVPIQCEFYALEGLGQLLNNVNLVQSSLNPDLRLTGIILTMYDGRTKLAEQVATEVRSHFPGKVYSSVIPRNVRLSEAPSFGQPVALYDPRSAGSLAYQNLAIEVHAGIGMAPLPSAGEGHDVKISSSIEDGAAIETIEHPGSDPALTGTSIPPLEHRTNTPAPEGELPALAEDGRNDGMQGEAAAETTAQEPESVEAAPQIVSPAGAGSSQARSIEDSEELYQSKEGFPTVANTPGEGDPSTPPEDSAGQNKEEI